ncbi:MAG: hypothetical protein COY40_01710 [Alphaproteobacteria bacterium CG_4_10_14_0_8_um_filter_53_9]|nr:MAG: hypothetical protein COY40_01710 [Alphaproteobacteria bacterium CG_4_10_14_0_8_um_filter_53_9]
MAITSTVTSTVFNLYLAIVCAFSLLSCIIIAGSGISTAIDLAYPAPVSEYVDEYGGPRYSDMDKASPLTEEQKAARAKDMADMRTYRNIKEMLSTFGYFFLAGLVFAVHWRIFRKRVVLSEMTQGKSK